MSATVHAPADRLLRSLPRTLSWFRHGRHDPTTQLGPGRFLRATHTPEGPGTLLLRWTGDHAPQVRIDAWGPGAEWLARRAPEYTADHRVPDPVPPGHPVVDRAARDHADLRTGASGSLYHELLPTVLEQRITSLEATRQWRRLCLALGEPAPGPFPGLVLPPAPAALWRRPAWWFHPLGIEAKRARTVVEVARVAERLWAWAELPAAVAADRLQALPGIGAWTVGAANGPALGDADAVAVGDYHLPHTIAWALAGEPRATDERMLALLEPYRGQRGRVIRIVAMSNGGAPSFGPRRRILPMHRW
jgi:hypothetical protein